MRLRNPELKDKERMLGWMKDPRTKTIFATDFASFTDEKVENFIKNANSDPKNLIFVFVDVDDNYLCTLSL